MAKATLPTNFKDDILADAMGNKRRYREIPNSDGTISLEDVTTYTQVGSTFGAAQINATNKAANASADTSKIIDDYDTLMANTQAGYMAGALAVKKLNSNLGGLTYSKITYTTGSSNQEIYTINEDCDVLIIYGIDGNSFVGYINSDKFSEIVYGKQYAWGTWDKILVVKGVKSGFQVRFGYASMQFLVIKGKK